MAWWSSEYKIKVKRESGSSSVLEVARVAKSMPGEYDATERRCDVPKGKSSCNHNCCFQWLERDYRLKQVGDHLWVLIGVYILKP